MMFTAASVPESMPAETTVSTAFYMLNALRSFVPHRNYVRISVFKNKNIKI